MAARLLDENGDLKPFEQWLNDVQPIADHQVRQWFQTEYDTAVKRAHIAAEWRQFEREADVLPNLEWIKSTSIAPGADHQVFWGTIRPVNDSFWNSHRPGDRWGCKCSLRATDKEATPVDVDDVPVMDRTKPARGLDNRPEQDGQIFSDSHPYNPPSCATCTLPGRRVISAGQTTVLGRLFNSKKNRKDCYHCSRPVELIRKAGVEPSETIYVTHKKYKNGGEVLIHPNVDKKGSDYKQLITIANQFAREGKSVKLTPSVHFKSRTYSQIYGSLSNTPYYRKCPDLKIGDSFYEFESYVPPFKKEKLRRMLNHGLAQSDKIIINNSRGASDRYIKKLIFDRIRLNKPIDEVWAYEKGKTRLLYKKQ
jgi:hypothetical protein